MEIQSEYPTAFTLSNKLLFQLIDCVSFPSQTELNPHASHVNRLTSFTKCHDFNSGSNQLSIVTDRAKTHERHDYNCVKLECQ